MDKLAANVQLFRWALESGLRRYERSHGVSVDLNRCYWTPPLVPHAAWELETFNIEKGLRLQSIVSITDHDDIDAPLTLRVLETCRDVPVSVEWTVPFDATFFHIGIHNLNASYARETMRELQDFTAHPVPQRAAGILELLSSDPAVLIVFNHPCWDEKGIGQALHNKIASDFVRKHAGFIHALEINGLRPWKENLAAIEFAKTFDLPYVAGGDRHGFEPNTIINLTDANSFAEFVDEVRSGLSTNLVSARYMEPFGMRVLESVQDVLADMDDHGFGWRRWKERVFYACTDGVDRSIAELWPDGEPFWMRAFGAAVDLARNRAWRHAFRFALARG